MVGYTNKTKFSGKTRLVLQSNNYRLLFTVFLQCDIRVSCKQECRI